MHGIVKRKWQFFIIITVLGFFIDAVTKYAAVRYLKHASPVNVFGTYIQFFLTYNTGMVFGLNPKALIPKLPLDLFFYIFQSIAIVVLLIYYAHLHAKNVLSHFGVALIMPGAMGNLFDRILNPGKGVVDFIKVDLTFWPFNPWPIFNVADIWITIGIGFVLIEIFLQSRKLAVR